jgi:hypothetical protein
MSDMALSDFPYPTQLSELPVSGLPLIGAWGKQRISSKAGPQGVDQMYVDSYGRQHEMGIKRHTVGQDPGGKWNYGWELSFYTHPGLRRRLPIDVEHLGKTKAKALAAIGDLVERMHSLAASPTDWMRFHGMGLHQDGFPNARVALDYLQENSLPWKYAKDRIPAEAFAPGH